MSFISLYVFSLAFLGYKVDEEQIRQGKDFRVIVYGKKYSRLLKFFWFSTAIAMGTAGALVVTVVIKFFS